MMKLNQLACMSLVALPLIAQAGTPCEDTPDPAITALFSKDVLDANAIESAIILQRAVPSYYDCALNLTQKVQVCDARLEQVGITRNQLTGDGEIATTVINSMPSLRACAANYTALAAAPLSLSTQ